MGKIISLLNQKGGVAKTTTAINLSYELTKAGKNVLLVDMDPQANATIGSGIFLQEKDIKRIDLMKINIEGCEYNLLECLIGIGFIKNIKNIQVQFHDFVEDAEKRMMEIQKNLQKTHYLTYQYPFVWENWEIKQKIKNDYSQTDEGSR
jgi:cellulose biosynthesis protein BcsQ